MARIRTPHIPVTSTSRGRLRHLSQSCLAAFIGIAWFLVGDATADDIVIDLGRGPVTVHVPSSYDPEVPTPLLMLLHGYGASGAWQESYMQFLPLAEEYGILYLYPDGTVDNNGNRFWNATDACCDFYGTAPDDSGYLRALLDEVAFQLNVDPVRVYVMGHSNGGFMSYRMACDHSDLIATIMSLAGATFADPADCSPAGPVHTLQIHGTADSVILYEGGYIGSNPYPGAVTTVQTWATYDGCDLLPDGSADPIDLDRSIPGDETTIIQYESGCDPFGSAELWTINSGGHVPNLSDEFSRLVIEFFFAHPKLESVGISGSPVVARTLLGPPTPTPFGNRTQVRYFLSDPAIVRVSVHDSAGREVWMRRGGAGYKPGWHTICWDGSNNLGEPVAPGVYYVHLQAGQESDSRRVVLLR